MKKLITIFFALFLIACSTSSGSGSEPEPKPEPVIDPDGSPVSLHGQLSIKDGTMVNFENQPVQLKGMSLFWSQWMPQYYNHESIENLVEHWDIEIIRAAMAVEHDGYLENPEREMNKVMEVIDSAIDLGIYVIVDWHDHHAEDHQEEAEKFFLEIAKKYHDVPNLIYEPYNEPLDVSWSEVLKPYHTAIINAIRKHDPDNIIVLGTPRWSQRVDLAAEDPIEAENIAYTLHFYAGTHGQELRDIATEALNQGIALFVTEYGTTNADGDGPVYQNKTQEWYDFMDTHNISWANWSVADKDESSAALLPGTTPSGIGDENNISTSGKLVRNTLLQQ